MNAVSSCKNCRSQYVCKYKDDLDRLISLSSSGGPRFTIKSSDVLDQLYLLFGRWCRYWENVNE